MSDVSLRCIRVNSAGYGCWLLDGHEGACLPDASRLGAVGGNGPCCRHCAQPLIHAPSGTWADTSGMVVCEVPGSGRYRGHEDRQVSESYREWRNRMDAAALESDLAARRGERSLPRREVTLGPMDPSDVIEPGWRPVSGEEDR